MPLALMLTLAVARGQAAAESPMPAPLSGPAFTRVRTTHTRLSNLIREGLEGSPTFRRLVAALEASDVVVYIEDGKCRLGYPNCLALVGLHGGQRYLRITVPANDGDGLRLIARMGHELQHASEIARAPEVVDTRSLLAFYASLDLRGGHGERTVETAAAVRAGDRVLDEMHAAHRSAAR